MTRYSFEGRDWGPAYRFRWGGPGIGWVDPVRERHGKGKRPVYRRVPKSWRPWFAASVHSRRFRDSFLRRFAGGLGVTYDEWTEAMIRPAVMNAVMQAYIDMPPPPPPTRRQLVVAWLRRRIPNRWYRFRNRVSQMLFDLSRAIERLADRI